MNVKDVEIYNPSSELNEGLMEWVCANNAKDRLVDICLNDWICKPVKLIAPLIADINATIDSDNVVSIHISSKYKLLQNFWLKYCTFDIKIVNDEGYAIINNVGFRTILKDMASFRLQMKLLEDIDISKFKVKINWKTVKIKRLEA